MGLAGKNGNKMIRRINRFLFSWLVIASLSSVPAYAQEGSSPEKDRLIQLGAKAGFVLNNPRLGFEQNLTAIMLRNGELGLQARVNLPKGFYLQPECMFGLTLIDWSEVDPMWSMGKTINYCLENYFTYFMDVPIYVGYKFYELDRAKFQMKARAFVAPQIVNLIDSEGNNGSKLFDNFAFRIGVGADLCKHLTVDFNYRLLFYNKTLDKQASLFTASIGCIF